MRWAIVLRRQIGCRHFYCGFTGRIARKGADIAQALYPGLWAGRLETFFSEFGCLQALLYLQRAEHVAQGLGLVAFRVEAVFYCGDSGVLHMAQRRDSFAFDACRHCF